LSASSVLALGKHALTLFDQHSQQNFLVDTGAEVSVIPANPNDNTLGYPKGNLQAANGTKIRSWGLKELLLSFGPKQHQFKWTFHRAEVTRPILGADFFSL